MITGYKIKEVPMNNQILTLVFLGNGRGLPRPITICFPFIEDALDKIPHPIERAEIREFLYKYWETEFRIREEFLAYQSKQNEEYQSQCWG